MLGNSAERLIVSAARAARTRSAAIFTSRFSRAARLINSERTGSPKLSHHAASGSSLDAATAAYFGGTSTVFSNTGVEHAVVRTRTRAPMTKEETNCDAFPPEREPRFGGVRYPLQTLNEVMAFKG